MIVDFEQDPDAPFGSGNFRDEKGKIMYVHDPDTARDFVKTLRGGGGGDQRMAKNTPIAPDGPPVTPGQAAASAATQIQSDVAGLERSVAAHDAAPAAAAPAQQTAQAAVADLDGIKAKAASAPADVASLEKNVTAAGGFDTKLSPDEEAQYQAWKQKYAPNDSGADYDLRGAYKAGLTPDATGHWPDTYKKPNHPTFSDESVYAAANPAKAGHWQAGQYVPPGAPAAPGAPATPGAPAAPGGALTPAQQAAQAAVADLDGIRAKADPRTVAPTPATLPQRPTLGLPAQSVSDSEGVTEAQGRPIDNVLADDAEIKSAQDRGDEIALAAAREADRKVAESYGRQQTGLTTEYEMTLGRINEAKQRQFAAEAEEKRLKETLAENERKLDPDRHMREMSGGKKLGMIILAALNGGFGAIIGDKENDVLNMVNAEIERDIDKQKREIDTGRVSISNDIAKFQKQGFDAKQAEELARDKADGALLKFLDLEAKRVGAVGENERAVRMAFAPKLEERAVRRAALLSTAETKTQRAIEARTVHAVPQVVPGAVVTPQDKLAQETLEDRRIQRENAAAVGDVVGHDVSIDEAKEIRNDSQDLGKRLSTGASARKYVDQLRRDLGLRKDPKTGKWSGDADPGNRPFGYSGTNRSTLIDTGYATLKRADIMGMVREPSAVLQNEFAKITERPFFDDQIAQQLDAYERVVTMAEEEARKGFSDEAQMYYDRKRTPVTRDKGRSGGGAPAPARNRPAAAAPSAPAPEAPSAPAPAPAPAEKKTKAPGGLRLE